MKKKAEGQEVKDVKKKKENKRNIHDVFFKKVFTNIKVTRDFLENYLPKEVVTLLDLSHMEKQTESFIDNDLEQYFADVLYSVKLGDREAYLYILFEHKSYDDNQVVFQILEYISKIYRKSKKENPSKKVPVVIPIVIFHSDSEWKQPLNLLEHMDLDLEKESSLIPYIPNFIYKFYDVTRMKREELHGTNLLLAVLIALKLKKKKLDFTLEEIIKRIDVVGHEDYEIFQVLLEYTAKMIEADKKKEFFTILKTLDLEMKEEYMTLAQAIENDGIQKGLQQGLQQGLKQGLKQGLHIGELNLVLKLLKKGYTLNKVSEMSEIPEEEIEEFAKKNKIIIS